jgi:hypothetical protein
MPHRRRVILNPLEYFFSQFGLCGKIQVGIYASIPFPSSNGTSVNLKLELIRIGISRGVVPPQHDDEAMSLGTFNSRKMMCMPIIGHLSSGEQALYQFPEFFIPTT